MDKPSWSVSLAVGEVAGSGRGWRLVALLAALPRKLASEFGVGGRWLGPLSYVDTLAPFASVTAVPTELAPGSCGLHLDLARVAHLRASLAGLAQPQVRQTQGLQVLLGRRYYHLVPLDSMICQQVER